MAKFTVDTHLFRELGELLVGRDSTALIELIKNAYDADATDVTVYGEQLDEPDRGRIHIVDNGVGMNAEDFEKGFLRVASRLKEQGARRSSRYQRRYTGAKGIGRLAAHKLARKLEVYSVPHVSEPGKLPRALQAAIDWDEIERYETLDELDSTDAIELKTLKAPKDVLQGTTLVLTHLRRAWTKTERARFLAEVQSSDPPSFLRESLPVSVLAKPLLFAIPVERDQSHEASDCPFRINLEGEFATGEEYWTLFADMANWVLEIRAGKKKVDFAIAPTKKTLRDNPDAKQSRHSIARSTVNQWPNFEARILVREGALRKLSRDQRVWAAQASGVRVYMEGFRVLPYGEPKDDWLSLDYDYTRRQRQLEILKDFGIETETEDPDSGLSRLPSNNYVGAIFLTQEGCPDMRLLVNREGFVPEASFDTLVRIVRLGIEFLTRERAAASLESRQRRREERQGRRDSGSVDMTALLQRMREASKQMKEIKTHLTGVDKEVSEAAIRGLDVSYAAIEELISERMLLYVLASVGTQMAAFVHEVNALLGAAQVIEHALEEILSEERLSLFEGQSNSKRQSKLRRTLNALTELRRGLERQASYLTDVVSIDARRRRSRQRLHERFDSAVRLIQYEASRRNIDIDNQIPLELKSPPMFPAELIVLFANLLTNAAKAAGEGGSIRATAFSEDEQTRILFQNTGVAVELNESERWFKPFQSTTTEVDSVLGQGMGLGLTITRNLLENYGASVKFVKPVSPFSTAVEIILPDGS